MLRACFGAGNHLCKPCKSRTDAMTCACTVAVRATCRQVPHGSVTHVLPGSQCSSLQKREKNPQTQNNWFINPTVSDSSTTTFESDAVELLVEHPPLKTDFTLLWIIMNDTHKLHPLAILEHAFPLLLGRSNSVFSYYCLLFRQILVILNAEI